jgi:hypothetical protein
MSCGNSRMNHPKYGVNHARCLIYDWFTTSIPHLAFI